MEFWMNFNFLSKKKWLRAQINYSVGLKSTRWPRSVINLVTLKSGPFIQVDDFAFSSKGIMIFFWIFGRAWKAVALSIFHTKILPFGGILVAF
jgi:hypothetical protein